MGQHTKRRGKKRASRKKAIKPKAAKQAQVDGLGPKDLKRIHKLLGQARRWSHPVTLVKKRSMGADGFPRCENKKCPKRGKPVPSIQVDHIEPIGVIGGPNYIKRMFVPSTRLQALCKGCHAEKTKREKKKKCKSFTDAW